MVESQSQHGPWSCGACHALRNVPTCQTRAQKSPKRVVAANGEQIRDLGEKDCSFQDTQGNFKDAQHSEMRVLSNLSFQCRKLVGPEPVNIVVLDEKNPNIRNTRDGTMINLDVNSGVCTTGVWICLDETGSSFQLAGDSKWSYRLRQACEASSTVCRV